MILEVNFWLAQSLRANTIGSEDGPSEKEDGVTSAIAANAAAAETMAAIVRVEKWRNGSTQILPFTERSTRVR